MTKVPERELSYGEILNRQRKYQSSHSMSQGTKDFVTKIIEEKNRGKHGAVTTTIPAVNSAYRCSHCEYTATDRIDSKRHWMTEHQD